MTLTSARCDCATDDSQHLADPAASALSVTSPKLDFPDGAAEIVTLDTANTTVTFKVKAAPSGTFPLAR